MACLSSFFPPPICSPRHSREDAGGALPVKNSRVLEALGLKPKEGAQHLSPEGEGEKVVRIFRGEGGKVAAERLSLVTPSSLNRMDSSVCLFFEASQS